MNVIISNSDILLQNTSILHTHCILMQSTSNYLARRFGVRAAMPGFIAKKLCPELVIVPLHFDKYKAASELVREILAKYDPHFSPVGLDESYLDLTEFVQLKLRQNATKSPDMAVAGSSGCDSDPEAHAGDLYSEDETWVSIQNLLTRTMN